MWVCTQDQHFINVADSTAIRMATTQDAVEVKVVWKDGSEDVLARIALTQCAPDVRPFENVVDMEASVRQELIQGLSADVLDMASIEKKVTTSTSSKFRLPFP